jgi:hypothetical protein
MRRNCVHGCRRSVLPTVAPAAGTEAATPMRGEATLRVLAASCSATGGVLFLEDVQWADAEMVSLLEHTTPSVREALLAQAGAGDDAKMGRTLSDLGAARAGCVLAAGRYRSIRGQAGAEIDRLHAVVDAGTKQRIVLHPDPRAFWAEADLQQRRDVVRLLIERVDVMPGRSALRRFDASRVRIKVLRLQPRVHDLSSALLSINGVTGETGLPVP